MAFNEKLLTISIAAYNVEPFIEKAINSCLSDETNDKIEILVIDDGATDGTSQIADQYAQQYPGTVRVIRKENGGYGSTINTSISMAKGKYFKLLDGDDWYDTDGLIALLSDLQTVDVDLFINPYITFSEKDGTSKLNEGLPNVESGEYSIESDIDFSNAMRMHYITFRTEILREMRRQITEHCFYTDIEFISFPLPLVKKIYVSHTPVYCYRIGREEQSMGVAGIRKHFSDHEIVFSNLFCLYENLEDKDTGYGRILYKLLQRECIGHYRYLFMQKISLKNARKLKELDDKLKKFPILYNELAEQRKMIAYLRKSKFLAYIPLCLMVVREKQRASW